MALDRHLLIQASFDYDALPSETAQELRLSAERIRLRLKRTAEDIIAIGQDLRDAKDRLSHGQFGPWLDAEFGMTDRTALNFMNVANRFGGKSETVSDLPIRALYLLAAPSTSDEIVAAVTSGEIPATAAAIKAARDAEAHAKAETERARKLAHEAEQQTAYITEQAQAQIDATTRQLTTLQRELDDLRNAPPPKPEIREVVKEVTPPQVQEQIRALEQRITDLGKQKAAIEKHAKDLQELAEAETQKHFAGENARRIRLKWYSTRTALAAAIRKALGDMPLAGDTTSFDADDWQGLAEVEAMVRRLCDTLAILHGAEGPSATVIVESD